jgi:N-acetylglucosaminyldiphosphoundecaprenol N-acetyl-beta-D-mannosaminyltransferase
VPHNAGSPVGSIRVLGCRVDAVDAAGAVERIVELSNAPPFSLVVTLGVEMVMGAQRDPDFRAALNGAALNVCDTIGLLLASRVRRGPLRSRVAGVELLADLAARSASHRDLKLFLLGGSGDTATRAAAALERQFPGVVICGTRDGYFAANESAAVAARIAASGANLLCAGLGSPKQERWLAQYGPATGCGAGIGVGGSLDVFAGTVMRAPRLVQRTGLEWAYRLVREPRRWRRQLALPQFVVAVVKELVFGEEKQRSYL